MTIVGTRTAQLVARPTIQAGLVLGGTAAALSLAPSLMPRPSRDQGLVAGGSMLGGFMVGAGVAAAASRLPGAGRPPTALLGIGAVSAAGAATALIARPDSSNLPRAAIGTAGALVAAGGVAAGTTLLLRAGSSALAGKLPPAIARLAGPAVGVAVAGGLLALASRSSGPDGAGHVSAAKSLATGAGAAALVGGLVVGLPALGGAGTRKLLGAATGAPRTMHALGAAATVGLLGTAGYLGLRSVLGKYDSANNRIEPAFSTPPNSPNVSGGPGSAIGFDALGRQGRRFVSEATSAAQITKVTGEQAVEPIRVYVGMDSAGSVDERVQLAIDELHRTGAFERDVLVMAAPSGTGFVNPIPIEAAEYMSRGSIATVAMQYGARPSVMSPDRIAPGREIADALHEAVAAEVAKLPAGERPRVVVYGESLGAHTSQDAYLHTGTELLEERGIDAALWVGTPFRSKWHAQVLRDGAPNQAVDPRVVGEFNDIGEVEALDTSRREDLRYTLLTHDNDPVGRMGIDVMVQQPSWLGDERPAGVDQPKHWLPIVSFFQTVVDAKNAATVVPGEFRATGHDYRADLAPFVRDAWDMDHVGDAELTRIEQQLMSSELERAGMLDG